MAAADVVDVVKQSLAFDLDFPAFVLIGMGVGFALLLLRFQTRADFDMADMLKDESGKASSVRMSAFVCLGISSWAIMYMLIKYKGTIDPWIFIGYMAIWSGANLAEKMIDAYITLKGGDPSKTGGFKLPGFLGGKKDAPQVTTVVTEQQVKTVQQTSQTDPPQDVFIEHPAPKDK